MHQLGLPLNRKNGTPPISSFTISPTLEIGAYEEMWNSKGASFKTIADRFREHPDSLPSKFIDNIDALQTGKHIVKIFRERGIDRFGVRIHRGGEYPDKLRSAKNPVELLYYRGWWNLVETRCVAVVGSRQVSELGVKRTKKLVRHLINDGFTIVSGLAQGVDTAAHKTAIEEKGNTIAVIGTPIHEYYPRENKELQDYIAQKHLLISQVPVIKYSRQDYRANRGFFPERNKTMSALTEATIIVEASNTSGTLTQARAALYQGRKLFVLDSCFNNKDLRWPADLQKKGAIRVKDYEDIRKVLVPR